MSSGSDHTPRTIVANTAFFTGALVIQKVVSFLYFWFLSAQLTPSLLGTYIWALSLTGAFSIGLDLGLSPLLIREAARDKDRAERLFRTVLGLKLVFTALTVLLLFVVLFVSNRSPMTVLVVTVAAAVMIFDSFGMSFYAAARARQQVRYESVGMLGFQILVFGFGAYLLGIAQSPVFAVAALALGSLVNGVFAWWVVRFRLRMRTSPTFDRETARSLLRLVPAFALSGIFVRLYNVSDSVLLGYLMNDEAVGLYSVPVKAITALQMLVPGAFMASVYPAMSFYYRTARPMLGRIFERSIGYLMIIVLPMTFGLAVLAPRIIHVVWPQYVAAIPTFVLLAFILPFLFLSFPTGYFLNATDRERQNTKNRGIITAANIAMNAILIPIIGVFGAGIALFASTVLLFVLDMRYVRRVITFERSWLLRVTGKAAGASILMVLVLLLLLRLLPTTSAMLLLTIVLGAAVYAGSALLFRIFSREEFAFVRTLFARPAAPEVIADQE